MKPITSSPVNFMGKMMVTMFSIARKSFRKKVLKSRALKFLLGLTPIEREGGTFVISERRWNNVRVKGGHIMILTTTVLTRYVQVANQLHEKDDSNLLTSGNTYVTEISGDPLFTTPVPPLVEVSSSLSDFSTCITNAAGGDNTAKELLDAKREEVLYLLTTLGNYVERIANDPANSATGPVAIIESAGMRAKPPGTHTARTALVVKPGTLHGTLICAAAAINGNGVHEWQYRLTGGDPDNWTAAPSTTASKTTLTGLERASMITVRHRTVTSTGTSDWEVYDGIVVP